MHYVRHKLSLEHGEYKKWEFEMLNSTNQLQLPTSLLSGTLDSSDYYSTLETCLLLPRLLLSSLLSKLVE